MTPAEFEALTTAVVQIGNTINLATDASTYECALIEQIDACREAVRAAQRAMTAMRRRAAGRALAG